MIKITRSERQSFTFERENELPPERRTTIFFKAASKRRIMEMGLDFQFVYRDGKLTSEAAGIIFDLVRDSMVGWKNVIEEDGSQVEFNKKDPEVNMEIFGNLDDLIEAFTFLQKINGLEVEDAKN